MASKAVKMKKRPSYIESLEELLYELEHPGAPSDIRRLISICTSL